MLEGIAKKWVKALRSGKYRQGRGVLRTGNDSYCCLGVLCDIAGAEWKQEGLQSDLNGDYAAISSGHEDYCCIPSPVVKATGMKTTTGSYDSLTDKPSLMKLNDEGSSFAQIADVIEKTWRQL